MVRSTGAERRDGAGGVRRSLAPSRRIRAERSVPGIPVHPGAQPVRSDHRKVTAEKKLDTYEASEADDNQLARLIDTERMHRLNDAVARLPPKLREALLLRYGAELEYGEVARIIDTNESTARSRVFMAICQLKDWAKEQAL